MLLGTKGTSIFALRFRFVTSTHWQSNTYSTLCRLPKQKPLDKEKAQTTAISPDRSATTPYTFMDEVCAYTQLQQCIGIARKISFEVAVRQESLSKYVFVTCRNLNYEVDKSRKSHRQKYNIFINQHNF